MGQTIRMKKELDKAAKRRESDGMKTPRQEEKGSAKGWMIELLGKLRGRGVCGSGKAKEQEQEEVSE